MVRVNLFYYMESDLTSLPYLRSVFKIFLSIVPKN
nr:MAG TPA: hypothetical protein [Herelleviridae sp.]